MALILIIEDDQNIRENLVDLLEANNYETIAVSNGADGITLAAQEMPDLIICDVMMPGLNGFQVAEAIRANKDTNMIRFVFLTAKVENTSIRRGMAYADDYLTKPYDNKTLLSVVTDQLERGESAKQFLKDFLESISKIKQETFLEISLEIPTQINRDIEDKIGNNLHNIGLCFIGLAEADTLEDKDFALKAGLAALAELAAIWDKYQKSKKPPQVS